MDISKQLIEALLSFSTEHLVFTIAVLAFLFSGFALYVLLAVLKINARGGGSQ